MSSMIARNKETADQWTAKNEINLFNIGLFTIYGEIFCKVESVECFLKKTILSFLHTNSYGGGKYEVGCVDIIKEKISDK